jgi:hypothetical protein
VLSPDTCKVRLLQQRRFGVTHQKRSIDRPAAVWRLRISANPAVRLRAAPAHCWCSCCLLTSACRAATVARRFVGAPLLLQHAAAHPAALLLLGPFCCYSALSAAELDAASAAASRRSAAARDTFCAAMATAELACSNFVPTARCACWQAASSAACRPRAALLLLCEHPKFLRSQLHCLLTHTW